MNQQSTTDNPKITFAVDSYTTFRKHPYMGVENS